MHDSEKEVTVNSRPAAIVRQGWAGVNILGRGIFDGGFGELHEAARMIPEESKLKIRVPSRFRCGIKPVP